MIRFDPFGKVLCCLQGYFDNIRSKILTERGVPIFIIFLLLSVITLIFKSPMKNNSFCLSNNVLSSGINFPFLLYRVEWDWSANKMQPIQMSIRIYPFYTEHLLLFVRFGCLFHSCSVIQPSDYNTKAILHHIFYIYNQVGPQLNVCGCRDIFFDEFIVEVHRYTGLTQKTNVNKIAIDALKYFNDIVIWFNSSI